MSQSDVCKTTASLFKSEYSKLTNKGDYKSPTEFLWNLCHFLLSVAYLVLYIWNCVEWTTNINSNYLMTLIWKETFTYHMHDMTINMFLSLQDFCYIMSCYFTIPPLCQTPVTDSDNIYVDTDSRLEKQKLGAITIWGNAQNPLIQEMTWCCLAPSFYLTQCYMRSHKVTRS